jgi:hypothetical protein
MRPKKTAGACSPVNSQPSCTEQAAQWAICQS